MENWNIVEILNHGFKGLGFLLAFLLVRMIYKEQRQENPRRSILAFGYVFMFFSLIIISLGFTIEYRQTGKVSKIDYKNVVSKPATDSWIAFDRKTGDALDSIGLLNDKIQCGVLKPNSRDMNLSIKMNPQYAISTEEGIRIGRLSDEDIEAYCSNKCEYAKTGALIPETDFSFSPSYMVKPFPIKLGFCINVPGILYFKVTNNQGKEAVYEPVDGNLIKPRETKTLIVDGKSYFISCIEYNTQRGISRFVLGKMYN
jgi:hypothetical protein